jgi:hypothetical protein
MFSLLKEKKTKKGTNIQEALFPGQTCPVGCAMPGFSWLFGAIAGFLKSLSLNFMCT